MTPEQTRDAVLDAVRRDLVGPLADPDGVYPSATPVLLAPGATIDRPRDAARLFVADDGYEVLIEPPTARYIVGALYPVLGAAEERELDAEQAPSLPDSQEADDDAADLAPRPAELPADADTAAPADDDNVALANAPADRPGRPSSFGLSFVVDAAAPELRLTVAGARYTQHPFTLMGSPRTGWHRVDVHEEVSVPLPADGRGVTLPCRLQVDPLRLEVGIIARPATGAQRIITCYLVNRTPAGGPPPSERVLFGASLSVALPADMLIDYPERDTDDSAEAATLRLLYADAPVRAVGHGVDAVVEPANAADGAMVVVRTETLPVARVTGTTPDIGDEHGPLAVDMDALGRWEPGALATVERMLSSYRSWIVAKERDAADLPAPAKATAERHLAICRAFADDVQAGWALAASGPVHDCLRWTSAAMAAQRRSYAADTRPVTVTDARVTVAGSAPSGPARWRPFQLAFVLANLGAIVTPEHKRRGVVDVIWMPTGGGKTEAYLALAAFTMLYRRRTRPAAEHGGTTVLMRYTLRLLTAQQLQRAASLLCALEVLRLTNKEALGGTRFSIGAWLGRASTPNWRKDALRDLKRLAERRRGATRPFLLSRCPACAAAMGDVVDGRVLGYSVQTTPSGDRMQASCPNPDCAFHLTRNPQGLPVYEVDEDIYERPPTFLVATVDKFAQLAWNERARVIFGLDQTGARVRPAPELVIQDELHLISGPLGSLVGLYESAIDQLCRHDGGAAPHVVAATATTRAYARQAEALYACPADSVRLVPPPGLDVADSFFAQADTASPPRAFLGVCATGLGKFPHAQMRVLASLSHAVAALEQAGADVDPWWTNVTFFGALRDLGQAKALIATDLRGYAWRLVRATGIRTGAPRPGKERRAIRTLTDVELTSASSNAASEALERLARDRGQPGCVDLALATSVIEVGVDVDRLGLLTIVRQPKTAAQYIQVAGRVGRDPRTGPGLVVVVLNPLTSRDMSHYERFTSVHQRLYAAVEPASVTPFTEAALTRGLRGALAAVVRQVRSGGDRMEDGDIRLIRITARALAQRARQLVGEVLGARVDAQAALAIDEAETAVEEQLGWGRAGSSGVQFLRPLEDPPPQLTASWPVLTSLRSVDADAALRIDEDWLPARTGAPTSDAATAPPAGASPATPVEEEESW